MVAVTEVPSSEKTNKNRINSKELKTFVRN